MASTSAIDLADKQKIKYAIHSYKHDPKHDSYGIEAAQALGVDPACVFKTLVVLSSEKELIVACVPVENQLDLKKLAQAALVKSVDMAPVALAQKTTGYIAGGISPLGQKKKLRTFLDESAIIFDSIYVSAGKRGLEIELSPTDLLGLTDGISAGIAK